MTQKKGKTGEKRKKTIAKRKNISYTENNRT